jgi:hypothetical protein
MRPTDIDVEVTPRSPKRIVVVAVPTRGMVSMRWMVSMQTLQAPINTPIQQLSAIGKEVGHARNNLVQRSLALVDPRSGARASHIFFVDDDCLLSMSALTQLWAHQKPIAAGLYYTKTEPPQPLILAGKHEGVRSDWTHGDVVECWAHGMGATLIDLDVFRTMYTGGHVEADPDGTCPVCLGQAQARACDGCFGTGHEIRWFHTMSQTLEHTSMGPEFSSQTEDVYFCERAVAAGYQPTVDTGVFAFHYAAPPIHYDDDRMPSDVCYPLPQWLEYQRTKQVTWGDEVAV